VHGSPLRLRVCLFPDADRFFEETNGFGRQGTGMAFVFRFNEKKIQFAVLEY
jgi:hypothetical protein